MRATILLIATLGLAVLAWAVMPSGEKKITTDGGVNLRGHTTVEVLADGEAKVRFWSSGIRRPVSAAGDTVYTLGENLPRQFSHSAGIDSAHVVLIDATYVLMSWR